MRSTSPDKPKLLFVVAGYSTTGAQAIRFKNMIPYLSEHYQVEVIELTWSKNPEEYEDPYAKFHRVSLSRVGRVLNPVFRQLGGDSGSTSEKKTSQKSRFVGQIKGIVRKLLFPDTYWFEIPRLYKKIASVLKGGHYESVILSAFPFSMLALAKRIKKDFPQMTVHYDVGDPFSCSSVESNFRNWLAKFYEKALLQYIDSLVVTNDATKRYYALGFRKQLEDAKISVVSMGVSTDSLVPISQLSDKDGAKNDFSLVYAGRLYTKFREAFELYKAIDKLNENQEARFHLHMYGKYNAAFYPAKYDPEKISFHGMVSNEQVFEAYSECTAIVFLDNAHGIQTPGKVFEVAAIGRPILFVSDNNESHSREIVKPLAHVVDCSNTAESIAEAILQLSTLGPVNPEEIEAVRHDFSWKKRAMEFRDVLESV